MQWLYVAVRARGWRGGVGGALQQLPEGDELQIDVRRSDYGGAVLGGLGVRARLAPSKCGFAAVVRPRREVISERYDADVPQAQVCCGRPQPAEGLVEGVWARLELRGDAAGEEQEKAGGLLRGALHRAAGGLQELLVALCRAGSLVGWMGMPRGLRMRINARSVSSAELCA